MSSALNTANAIFASRVKRARREAKLTQENLAREIGCTTRSVQGWEAGDSLPRGARLRGLAEVTGKPVAWFYEEEAA